MRATGIVRKIDSLGRVVIPKEVRTTLRIRDGEPLEIFTDSAGGVVFRKYSHVGSLADCAEKYAQVLAAALRMPVAVTDLDRIVAAAPAAWRSFAGRPVGGALEAAGEARLFAAGELSLCDGARVAALAPVRAQGTLAGCIAALYKPQDAPPVREDMLGRLETAAGLLTAQCE